MPEILEVARTFDEWEIVDAPPALDPIVEPPPGMVGPHGFRLGLGTHPQRLVLQSENGRWLAQMQHDRIAVHERKVDRRPSFGNVRPKLDQVSQQVSRALGPLLLIPPYAPEIVEVIYENHITAGDGWDDFSELSQVLRFLAPLPADHPIAGMERASAAFSTVLQEEGQFAGRMHVVADPLIDDAGQQHLQLRLISRRYARERSLSAVLESCHTDIVEGFTAVTTEEMHKLWKRFR